MANKFCRYLGNQYRLDLNGIAPCCYYQKRVDFFDKTEFENFHSTLTAQTDWTPECNYCKQREDNNQASPRQHSLMFYSQHGLAGHNDPDELTSLEIQTDIDCNGACLICGPESSTTWQKHEAKFNPQFKIIEDKKVNVIDRIARAKEIFNFSKLKKIGFVNGGEPLKSNTHLLYLREVAKTGNLKNVSVTYVTNGSMRPCEETISLWREANDVRLSISIDGIGEHFNYLRWPLNFDQVQSNIAYILGLKIKGRLAISYAITPFNAFYHDKYVEWGQDFFAKCQPGPMVVDNIFKQPFKTSGVVNMSCVPPRLRFEIIKKYGTDHPVTRLTDFLNKEAYKRFMDYINTQDQRRKLNFRTVFPEIQQYFKD